MPSPQNANTSQHCHGNAKQGANASKAVVLQLHVLNEIGLKFRSRNDSVFARLGGNIVLTCVAGRVKESRKIPASSASLWALVEATCAGRALATADRGTTAALDAIAASHRG